MPRLSLLTPLPMKRPVTVVVMASFARVHPSTAIISETILSLRLLQLPRRTPVLVAHNGPPIVDTEFPPSYLEYLTRVRNLLPRFAQCTGFALQLVLRSSDSGYGRNIEFALSFVRTPFVLKVEHDHFFTRRLDVLSIVRDMLDDTRIKMVRFNRRRNERVKCDDGDSVPEPWRLRKRAQMLWYAHRITANRTHLRNVYTRTACWSDINHLARTDYYRDEIFPLVVRDAARTPEVHMNKFVVFNHSRFGTFVYGGPGASPTVVHADAAWNGHGERVEKVLSWVQNLIDNERGNNESSRTFSEEPPFACLRTFRWLGVEPGQ